MLELFSDFFSQDIKWPLDRNPQAAPQSWTTEGKNNWMPKVVKGAHSSLGLTRIQGNCATTA